MTAGGSIRECLERAGVTPRLTDRGLRVGPAACVTEALRAFLADNRAEILAGLERRQAFADAMAEAFPGCYIEAEAGNAP